MNTPDLLRAGGWRQGHIEDVAYWEHAERHGLVRWATEAALADELAHVSRERDWLQALFGQALALLREAAPALLEGAKELRKVVSRARSAVEPERARLVIDAARKLTLHWNDQDGVNASVIDEVCAAVVAYDSHAFEETEVGAPSSRGAEGSPVADLEEVWFCTSCEDVDVKRSDEDRCCLMCGVDLTSNIQMGALLGKIGLRVVGEAAPTAEAFETIRTIVNAWCVGKFSDRHFEAHKAMRELQGVFDSLEIARAAKDPG